MNVYRETSLLPAISYGDMYGLFPRLNWSPCGKFIAGASGRFIDARWGPFRIFIWRASTGALVKVWELATPAAPVSREVLQYARTSDIRVAFSRDSTRVLTLFRSTNHFSLWNVPDGQLVAVNRGVCHGDSVYEGADFGVPGSASEGLIGFSAPRADAVDLWDFSPSRRLRRRSRVQMGPHSNASQALRFRFSPDGSKFAAALLGVAYVYAVASLTRLAVYHPPFEGGSIAWAPHGHVLVFGGGRSACVWDFSRPEEAPSVVTAHVGRDAQLHSWSPSGASYFVVRKLGGRVRARGAPATISLQERRAADGSLVRAVNLRHRSHHQCIGVYLSPDAHALAIYPLGEYSKKLRVAVF